MLKNKPDYLKFYYNASQELDFGDFKIPQETKRLKLKNLSMTKASHITLFLPRLTHLTIDDIGLKEEEFRSIIQHILSYEGLESIAIENGDYEDQQIWIDYSQALIKHSLTLKKVSYSKNNMTEATLGQCFDHIKECLLVCQINI